MRGKRERTLFTAILLIIAAFLLQGCPSLIPNRSPSASFTADPLSGKVPLTVQFDASNSHDPDKDQPDGKIVSYKWTFGDGETGSGQLIQHTYDESGSFKVRLTVTDGKGASDTASKTIAVTGASGTLDAFFGTIQKSNQSCLGDGTGSFSCSDVSSDEKNSTNIALGDLNNDGFLDAVASNVISNTPAINRVCLGDGTGSFNCNDVSSDLHSSRDVTLGDIDEDGLLDAVFANQDADNNLCLGDGNGGFNCSLIPGTSDSSHGVAVGDVTGNNHRDILFSSLSGSVQLCEGNGTTSVSCSTLFSINGSTMDVELGHVNDDHHLDAVFASANFGGSGSSKNQICLGDGTGSFSCSPISSVSSDSLNVELADVNDDGFVDAAFANNSVFTTGTDQRNRICLGDGSGRFTCSPISSANEDSRGLDIGDINDDKKLDILIANSGPPSRGCLGDGSGSFSCSNLSADTTPSHEVALGRLDD